MGLKRGWALELSEITEENGASHIRNRRKLMLPAVQPDTRITLEKVDETSRVTGFPSDSDSVLAFYVGASSRSGENQTFLFSVLTKTLRSFTETTIKSKRRFPQVWKKRDIDTRPFVVPWNEWGPGSTRWINVGNIPMTRTLTGTRCVISEMSTGRVRMLDFTPERLSWIDSKDSIDRSTRETGGKDWRVMTPPTILAGDVFQNDLESKLPYYEIGVRVEAGLTFLIDDKCVVMIRVCSNNYNVANIRLISNIFHITISRYSDRILLMVILRF